MKNLSKFLLLCVLCNVYFFKIFIKHFLSFCCCDFVCFFFMMITSKLNWNIKLENRILRLNNIHFHIRIQYIKKIMMRKAHYWRLKLTEDWMLNIQISNKMFITIANRQTNRDEKRKKQRKQETIFIFHFYFDNFTFNG